MVAKKPTKTAAASTATSVASDPSTPRPRLHKLRVSNFRGIGVQPVEVELDDIVVLVGPNNAGKSSILRAYEVVMLHGSAEGTLTIDDFPGGVVDPARLPTIELETVVFDKTAPGERWVRVDAAGEMFVHERWTWSAPGQPKKVGREASTGVWHDSEGPWGAPGVAQAYRPKPHRVSAFLDPAQRVSEVVALLKEAIKLRVKDAATKKATEGEAGEASDYDKLLESIRALQKNIATEASAAVEDVRTQLAANLADVFPGYAVKFDARPEDDIEKTLSLFKTDPVLRMGPDGAYQTTLERQGSGACRTLLWAALRVLAERTAPKKDGAERTHILLIDEPELCLHPDAVREARRVLYDLPKTNRWQVMVTTHSPVFIDLSRDNTSIVRVERSGGGSVSGTTIYRPGRARLDDDDRAELKLLNVCDPYVAEFFFGGHTVVVEGDTEHTAFKYVIDQSPESYRGVHVVRARGKACIGALCKILDQFNKSYAVLHDADRETVVGRKSKKPRANPAWTENKKILAATGAGRAANRVRVIASVPNFEEAFLGEAGDTDKPYTALVRLRKDDETFETVAALLNALLDPAAVVPAGAIDWSSIDELTAAVRAHDDAVAAATA